MTTATARARSRRCVHALKTKPLHLTTPLSLPGSAWVVGFFCCVEGCDNRTRDFFVLYGEPACGCPQAHRRLVLSRGRAGVGRALLYPAPAVAASLPSSSRRSERTRLFVFPSSPPSRPARSKTLEKLVGRTMEYEIHFIPKIKGEQKKTRACCRCCCGSKLSRHVFSCVFFFILVCEIDFTHTEWEFLYSRASCPVDSTDLASRRQEEKKQGKISSRDPLGSLVPSLFLPTSSPCFWCFGFSLWFVCSSSLSSLIIILIIIVTFASQRIPTIPQKC